MHLASISSQEENDKLEKHIKEFGKSELIPIEVDRPTDNHSLSKTIFVVTGYCVGCEVGSQEHDEIFMFYNKYYCMYTVIHSMFIT